MSTSQHDDSVLGVYLYQHCQEFAAKQSFHLRFVHDPKRPTVAIAYIIGDEHGELIQPLDGSESPYAVPYSHPSYHRLMATVDGLQKLLEGLQRYSVPAPPVREGLWLADAPAVHISDYEVRLLKI